MSCKTCRSDRVASISAKSSDMNAVGIGERRHEGGVPRDMGVGGGDYVRFSWCLDCGFMAGSWPLPQCELERPEEE